jgi:hypothetical protein
VDELLKLTKNWLELYKWQYLQDVWVSSFIGGETPETTNPSRDFKEYVRLIKQLQRINDLVLEHFPFLHKRIALPNLGISELPFIEEEIPDYCTKMNLFYGSLLAFVDRPISKGKSGAPLDPDHETIIARAKELRAKKKTWKEVADILSQELGRNDLDAEKVRDRCRGNNAGKN